MKSLDQIQDFCVRELAFKLIFFDYTSYSFDDDTIEYIQTLFNTVRLDEIGTCLSNISVESRDSVINFAYFVTIELKMNFYSRRN